MEHNQYDVPFAILYSVEETWVENLKISGATPVKSRKRCVLEGAIGIPDVHIASPASLDLEESSKGYASAFRLATEVGDPIVLRTHDGTLPEPYVQGFGSRGFGDPCNAVVVCPIRPTGRENVVGFMILGLNPRQGYDDDERQFIDILTRQIATSVASVALLDEEIRRGRTYAQEAALQQAKLEDQLDLRTQELMNSETKFELMSSMSPVGMMTADLAGRIAYANQAWYNITGHPGGIDTKESWLELFEAEEMHKIEGIFEKLLTSHEPTTFEIRLRKPWIKNLPDGETVRMRTWVLVNGYVEELDDGTPGGVRSTVTDISEQKWAEEVQKRRMEEAIVSLSVEYEPRKHLAESLRNANDNRKLSLT